MECLRAPRSVSLAGFGRDEQRTVGIQLQHIGSLSLLDEIPREAARRTLGPISGALQERNIRPAPETGDFDHGRREIVRPIEKIGLAGRIDILMLRVQS